MRTRLSNLRPVLGSKNCVPSDADHPRDTIPRMTTQLLSARRGRETRAIELDALLSTATTTNPTAPFISCVAPLFLGDSGQRSSAVDLSLICRLDDLLHSLALTEELNSDIGRYPPTSSLFSTFDILHFKANPSISAVTNGSVQFFILCRVLHTD